MEFCGKIRVKSDNFPFGSFGRFRKSVCFRVVLGRSQKVSCRPAMKLTKDESYHISSIISRILDEQRSTSKTPKHIYILLFHILQNRLMAKTPWMTRICRIVCFSPFFLPAPFVNITPLKVSNMYRSDIRVRFCIRIFRMLLLNNNTNNSHIHNEKIKIFSSAFTILFICIQIKKKCLQQSDFESLLAIYPLRAVDVLDFSL